jgi:hypothetical protein
VRAGWWPPGNGRDDEAVAVGLYWPVLRDNLTEAGVTLGDALADLARYAGILGRLARDIEERRLNPESGASKAAGPGALAPAARQCGKPALARLT